LERRREVEAEVQVGGQRLEVRGWRRLKADC
jgi:hypothetical protein